MMSHNSKFPSHRVLQILAVGAFFAGAAFFWSNQKPTPGTSVAVAAPKAAAPRSLAKPKPASKIERTRAQKTIQAQLKAFDAGNWAQAVKFQSDGLKGNFSSPEAFGAMIVQTYPAFVHPKNVEFGQAVNIDGHIQFLVTLTGQDGSTTRAIYSLVEEKGNYRIEGVAGGATAAPTDDNSSSV